MENLIKEAKLMQLKAGLITEDEYHEAVDLSKNDTPNMVGKITSLPQLKSKLMSLAKAVDTMKLNKNYKADGPELTQLGMLLDNIMDVIGKPESIANALRKANQAFTASKINLDKEDI